jgi:methylmalonyl-CoA mutase cobalamin-binding subunit
MAETMVLLAGGFPLYLGAQTPLEQIIQMAKDADVNVVAISMSAAYSLKEFRRFIKKLDDELPKKIDIWIGGAGARELKNSSRIKLLKLEDVATNLGNSGRN